MPKSFNERFSYRNKIEQLVRTFACNSVAAGYIDKTSRSPAKFCMKFIVDIKRFKTNINVITLAYIGQHITFVKNAKNDFKYLKFVEKKVELIN